MLISEEKEFQIGQGVDKEVREEMGIYLELPDLRAMLKEVVEKLGKNSDPPDLIFRFTRASPYHLHILCRDPACP